MSLEVGSYFYLRPFYLHPARPFVSFYSAPASTPSSTACLQQMVKTMLVLFPKFTVKFLLAAITSPLLRAAPGITLWLRHDFTFWLYFWGSGSVNFIGRGCDLSFRLWYLYSLNCVAGPRSSNKRQVVDWRAKHRMELSLHIRKWKSIFLLLAVCHIGLPPTRWSFKKLCKISAAALSLLWRASYS